jgi:hypothetical protein
MGSKGHEEASHHVGQARGAPENPLIIGQASKKEATDARLLRRSPLLEG